ncbi:unnamed protein product [Brassica rapa subsp. trilocularis]
MALKSVQPSAKFPLNLGHSLCVSEDPEATEEDLVDDEVAEIRVDYRRSR